jgi:hypothetical protein
LATRHFFSSHRGAAKIVVTFHGELSSKGGSVNVATPKVMKHVIHLSLLLVLASGQIGAAPLGTAFTYQGRLTDGPNAANGAYDFEFAVYDAANGGNRIGNVLPTPAVTVTQGAFMASLDFGANIFMGDARWLAIGVRKTSLGGAYTSLDPRQPLTPAPYALYAENTGSLPGGQMVTSLNGLRNDVVLSAGANITLTPTANGLTIGAAGTGGSGIWEVLNNNAHYGAGNVGIGTAQPNGKLTVTTSDDTVPMNITSFDTRHSLFGNASEGLAVSYSASSGAGYVSALAPGVAWKDIVLQARALSFKPSGGAAAFSVSNEGNVGIGTAPDSGTNVKLYVKTGGNFGIYGQSTSTGEGVHGASSFGTGVFGEGLIGVKGYSTDANGQGVHGFNEAGGPGVVGLSSGGYGVRGTGPTAGVFGASTAGTGVLAENRGASVGNPALRANNTHPNGIGIYSTTASGDANLVIANNGAGSLIKAFSSANGGGESVFEVFNDGGTQVKSLSITGGADVAEPFEMTTAEIPRGAVVVIDDENPGKLKLSDKAYDHRVAGIVSGANGISPGITLHQEGAFQGGQNVALSGRVYVQADASTSPIRPGDVLTTSDLPGHAMKVRDHNAARGAIVGKAMSPLKEGKGMVLVLVNLQ